MRAVRGNRAASARTRQNSRRSAAAPPTRLHQPGQLLDIPPSPASHQSPAPSPPSRDAGRSRRRGWDRPCPLSRSAHCAAGPAVPNPTSPRPARSSRKSPPSIRSETRGNPGATGTACPPAAPAGPSPCNFATPGTSSRQHVFVPGIHLHPAPARLRQNIRKHVVIAVIGRLRLFQDRLAIEPRVGCGVVAAVKDAFVRFLNAVIGERLAGHLRPAMPRPYVNVRHEQRVHRAAFLQDVQHPLRPLIQKRHRARPGSRSSLPVTPPALRPAAAPAPMPPPQLRRCSF